MSTNRYGNFIFNIFLGKKFYLGVIFNFILCVYKYNIYFNVKPV